jgi:FKBP12-rapamycin complex-associated protein
MWARGEYEKSLSWLRTFSGRLADDLGLDLDNPTERVQEVRGMPKMSEYISLLARCYLKQGGWQSALKDDWNPVRFLPSASIAILRPPIQDNIREILHAYNMSTQLDPTWYKAWHTWALANFEVVNHLEAGIRAEELLPETLVTHVIAAIRGTDTIPTRGLLSDLQCPGFFRSISLSERSSLQDVLRLLTLWFKFGAHDDVCHAIGDGFSSVAVDTWLEVVPQVCNHLRPCTTPNEPCVCR